jgi:MFS family permease
VFRSVLSVVIGLVIGVTIIGVVESIGHRMYPPPADLDVSSSAALKEWMKQAPPGHFVMVLVAWYLGTSTGAGVGAYMASEYRWRHGWIVAGILMLCGIIMLFMYPHPGWFTLATLVVFPVAATVGMLIGTQPIPGKREGYVIEGPPDYSKEAEERMKMAGR